MSNVGEIKSNIPKAVPLKPGQKTSLPGSVEETKTYTKDQVDSLMKEFIAIKGKMLGNLNYDKFNESCLGLYEPTSSEKKQIEAFLASNARKKVLSMLQNLFKQVYLYRNDKAVPALDYLLTRLKDLSIIDPDIVKFQTFKQINLNRDEQRLVYRFFFAKNPEDKKMHFDEIARKVKGDYSQFFNSYNGKISPEKISKKANDFISALGLCLDDSLESKNYSNEFKKIKFSVSQNYLTESEKNYIRGASEIDMLNYIAGLYSKYNESMWGSAERVKNSHKYLAALDAVSYYQKLTTEQIGVVNLYLQMSNPDKINFGQAFREIFSISNAVDAPPAVRKAAIRFIAKKVGQRIIQYNNTGSDANDIDKKLSIETIIGYYFIVAKQLGASKETLNSWANGLRMPKGKVFLPEALKKQKVFSINIDDLTPKMKKILKDAGLLDFAMKNIKRIVFIKDLAKSQSPLSKSSMGGAEGGHYLPFTGLITMSFGNYSEEDIAFGLAHEIAHAKFGDDNFDRPDKLSSVSNERNSYSLDVNVRQVYLKNLIAENPIIDNQKFNLAINIVYNKILVDWCDRVLKYPNADLNCYPTMLGKMPSKSEMLYRAKELLKELGAKEK